MKAHSVEFQDAEPLDFKQPVRSQFRQNFSYLGDDGLPTPDVGEWCQEKYRLVSGYAAVFSTSMKNKWEKMLDFVIRGSG